MRAERPHVAYTRRSDPDLEPLSSSAEPLAEALALARRVVSVLEETPAPPSGSGAPSEAHSVRIARAMAEGLVDELEVLNRHPRKAGLA